MDILSIIGFILAAGFVLLGIVTSGSLSTFIDIPSILIVVGGTVGSILLSSSGKNAKNFLKVIQVVIKQGKSDDLQVIDNLVDYSSKARREGLLSLEESVQSIDDSFIKNGMMMIIDGVEPEGIKKVLSLKIRSVMERHKGNRSIFDTGAALSPAFGMIGTLIGLVNMLKNLSDPSTIGPQMSVALITTFYGSLMANVFFMPVSKKLKARTAEEVFQKEMILEGLLSIQMGENPSIMRKKLMSYLDEKETRKIELLQEQAANF
jgi:chemotaxis protein MotA